MGEEVKVYIYDLSKGVAKAMSKALLGKQIDGIWHTAIVVYGKEYFYGGTGIEYCEPGMVGIGPPDEVISLGYTRVSLNELNNHLRQISTTSFRGACYHLLDHNCNNFSNHLAEFLTGHGIPSHITSLPNEVLSTPFGAMIRPFLNEISVNPGAHHTIDELGGQGANGSSAGPSSDEGQSAIITRHSNYCKFDDAKDLQDIIDDIKDANKRVVADLHVPEDAIDALGQIVRGCKAVVTESLQILQKLLQWPVELVTPCLDLMRLAIKDTKVNEHFCAESSPDFMRTMTSYISGAQTSAANQLLALKILCNVFLHSPGERLIMKSLDMIIDVLVFTYCHGNTNTRMAVSSLIYNCSIAILFIKVPKTRQRIFGAVEKMICSPHREIEGSFPLFLSIGTLLHGEKSKPDFFHSDQLQSFILRFKDKACKSSAKEYVGHLSQMLGKGYESVKTKVFRRKSKDSDKTMP